VECLPAYRLLDVTSGLKPAVCAAGAYLFLFSLAPAAMPPFPASCVIAFPITFTFTARQINDLGSQVGSDMFDFPFANMRMVDLQIDAGDGYDFKTGDAGPFPNIASFAYENFTHCSLPEGIMNIMGICP
jgi:hypothetical protein